MARSLFSCAWILEKDSVLPMNIQALMEWMSEDWKNRINELIDLKKTVGEKYLHPKDVELNERISALLELVEKSQNNLRVNKTDMSYLNRFFLKTVNGSVDN